MLFSQVRADAFGPFDGAVLEMAPGMNVIWGPNESGKSSWHAAMVAGLCGVARTRGATTKEHRELERRRRPRSRDRWAVGVTVTLERGDRIEFRQNLAERTGTALDADLGRDRTVEFLHHNSPDGAKLVGLDRETFKAVACVAQAAILGITADAVALQDDLQRAAATAGTKSTASEAIASLDRFLETQVGQRRANSRRPLQAALVRAEETARELDRARAVHDQVLRRAGYVEEAERAATEATRTARRAEAAHAALSAKERLETNARVQHLAATYPSAPPGPADDAQLAARVQAALHTWMASPAVPEPPERASSAVEAELASLPHPSSGDREIDGSVGSAKASLDWISAQLAGHDESLPELTPVASLDASAALIAAGAVVTVAAGAAAVLVGPAFALVGALGVVLVVAGALRRARSRAGGSESVQGESRRRSEWQQRRGRLAADQLVACQALTRAIAARGEDLRGLPATDLLGVQSAYDRYAAACRRRRADHEQDVRRSELAHELRAAKSAERQRADDLQRLAAAAQGVVRLAAEVGQQCASGSAPDAADGLQQWLAMRQANLEETERQWKESLELEALLRGSTPAEFTAKTDLIARRARELRARLDDPAGDVDATVDGLDADALGPEPETMLADLRQRADDAHAEAVGARRALAEFAGIAPSVAEAEEVRAAAARELDRVTALDDVLARTRRFLVGAEVRVHHDIAPVLAAKTSRPLAKVTGGRYHEVVVDPQTLQVNVRLADGSQVDASRLSHGTAEQVYLLLRVAISDVLGSAEPCPILLDDPTVHADAERTLALLDALHEVSATRQVVLFTQEDDVRCWAQRALAEPRDRLVELDVLAVVSR